MCVIGSRHMPHEIVRLKSGRTLPTPDSSDGLSSVKLLIIIAGVLMGGFILALLVVNVLTERAMGRPGEATAKFLPADTQVYFTTQIPHLTWLGAAWCAFRGCPGVDQG